MIDAMYAPTGWGWPTAPAWPWPVPPQVQPTGASGWYGPAPMPQQAPTPQPMPYPLVLPVPMAGPITVSNTVFYETGQKGDPRKDGCRCGHEDEWCLGCDVMGSPEDFPSDFTSLQAESAFDMAHRISRLFEYCSENDRMETFAAAMEDPRQLVSALLELELAEDDEGDADDGDDVDDEDDGKEGEDKPQG